MNCVSRTDRWTSGGLGLLAFEKIKDMAAKWSHAGPTADKEDFRFTLIHIEFTEGTCYSDVVSRLEIEDIGRYLAGR